MAVELAKTKNIDALETFFLSITEVLDDDQLTDVFAEVATTIRKQDPELLDWYLDELDSILEAEVEIDDEDEEIEDEEEGVFYIAKEDIAHLLLDEGLDPKEDFEEAADVILLSQRAKAFLQEHYDLELIASLIQDKA